MAGAALAGVPAALVVALSFKSGGYPPGVPAAAAAVLLLMLALRALLAPTSVRLPGGAGRVVGLGLAGLTVLALTSMAWSDAPARAVTGASRGCFYLAAFLTIATLPRPSLDVVLRSVLAGIVVVASAALATRLLPDVFPLSADASQTRLAYPLAYQNALGLQLGIGVLLALQLTSERRAGRGVMIAAAGVIPPLVCALYMTQSRGAIGATALGLLVWLLGARSRWPLVALGVVALPTLVALSATFAAVDLVSPSADPAAVPGQGFRVALVLAAAVAAAASLRARAARLDARLAAIRLPAGARIARIAIPLVGVVLFGGAAIAVARNVDELRLSQPAAPSADPRSRLVQLTNSGRLELWRGGASTFIDHPMLGAGADTFETSWLRNRPSAADSTEAHSLYIESLAELGAVGLLLLIVTIMGLIGALAGASAPRPSRAAAIAAVAAWASHAAIDWDWEMPAVTVIPFLLAAAAQRPATELARAPRVGLAAVTMVVAAVPATWAISQAFTDGATAAYAREDCGAAIARAGNALRLTPFRPDARIVRAACRARAGEAGRALADARAAQRGDPYDYRYAYDTAAILAAAGADGQGEASRAMRLNPRGRFGSWLHFWLTPGNGRPPQLIAGLAPLLAAGELYPPVLEPYARRPG